jgi:hypothetical protein
MKKLGLMATNLRPSYLLVSLQAVTFIVFIHGALEVVHAADFSCPPIMLAGSAMATGDVTCLIAAINSANGMPGQHVINLAPGIYTLQIVDNNTDGANGLPSIKRSIQIQSSGTIHQPSLSEIQARRLFAFFMYLSAAN